MKKILLVAGLAGSLFFSSCSDSFITSTPSTELPGDEGYTPYSIGKAMVAAYQPLQWFDVWMPLPILAEAMGDDIRIGGGSVNDQKALHDISRYKASAIDHPDAVWNACYTGIFRTNIIINNAPTLDMVQTTKDRLVAEAYALRTFYYFQLWRFYGNIPFFENNPVDILNDWKDIKQYKVDEVYEKLIRDINLALEDNKLPTTVDPSEYGRMTRAAAQMLKAHIVLMQEDQTKYGEVLDDMEEILGSPQYGLMDDFAAIWEDSGEWCKESIFEINYTDYGGTRGWGDDIKNPGGSVFPTLVGINGFSDTKFASGWGFMPIEPHLYNLYDDADQRKNKGILNFTYYKANVNPAATYDNSRWDDTGYFNKKYLPRKGENSNATGSQDLNYRNNLRVFRLADTYLIAAELIVRTGGTQSVADGYLNEVRGRAYNHLGTYQKVATLDNILAERRLEFAGEGYRFFDLLRFGKANSITKSLQTEWDSNGGRVYGQFTYSPTKRYFPIPQSEVDRSLGAITQNTY